jgi:hypothetical protein
MPGVGVFSSRDHPGSAGPFVEWAEVANNVESLTSSEWDLDDLQVLGSFFGIFRVPSALLDSVLKYASSCSKSAAESIAFKAGDSERSSAYLRNTIDRNVAWLREARGDVAALGKRIRAHLAIPDISDDLPEPLSAEERTDFALVKRFATRGVDLVYSENFVPTSVSKSYPAPRKLFERVRPAVLSLLADVVKKGQALVLPLPVARSLDGANSIPVHWVPKNTNPLGRLIADASGGDHPPNGAECKDAAAELYGPIMLPRAADVAQFLLSAAATYKDPTLSVDDISGAFSRLWLSRDSAAKSTLEVTLDDGFEAGVVLSSMYFGGSSCPHAWQVVSRVLHHLLLRADIPSMCYVDDILRAGEGDKSESDGIKTRDIICSLLTPNTEIAWAAEKATWGVKRAPYIGWEWRLDSLEVALTARSVVRFALRLLSMRDREKTSVRALQGVASLGVRFSDVIPSLGPLSFIFYDRVSGHWSDIDAKVPITPLLRIAVWFWIILLVRAWNDGRGWARPLRRLLRPRSNISLQFDGCLYGVGGVQPALVGPEFASVIPPFAYSIQLPYIGMSSSQQNVTELLAVVFGLACAIRLGLRDSAVHLVGDSRTALAWVTKRVKSEQALRTYLLFHFLMEEAELSVGSETWLASATNVVPDGLSRLKEVRSFAILRDHLSDVLPPDWITAALEFCNPLIDLPHTTEGFSSMFDRAQDLVRQLF